MSAIALAKADLVWYLTLLYLFHFVNAYIENIWLILYDKSMVIRKKITPKFYNLVKAGNKKFELRLADFNIKKGDILILEEWNPKSKKYTGRTIKKKVKFLLYFKLNDFGQAKEIKKHGLYVIQI